MKRGFEGAAEGAMIGMYVGPPGIIVGTFVGFTVGVFKNKK